LFANSVTVHLLGWKRETTLLIKSKYDFYNNTPNIVKHFLDHANSMHKTTILLHQYRETDIYGEKCVGLVSYY